MPESLTVGTWNAHNSFGNELVPDAVKTVERMDADVLFIGETTFRELEEDEYEHFQEARNEMCSSLAYTQHIITNYSPYEEVRDEHTMSMWTRGNLNINQLELGQRYGFRVFAPSMGLSNYGVHFDDQYESSRLQAVEAVLKDWEAMGGEAVVMGDLNAMDERDPKARMLKPLGCIVCNMEVPEYYDSRKKLQNFGGKIIRACRMAQGDTLRRLTEAGLVNVDSDYAPTRSTRLTGFKIDHILASKDLVIDSFYIHSRFNREGKELSDHHPITARVIA